MEETTNVLSNASEELPADEAPSDREDAVVDDRASEAEPDPDETDATVGEAPAPEDGSRADDAAGPDDGPGEPAEGAEATEGDLVAASDGAFVDVTARTAHAEDIAWLAGAGISEGWPLAGGKREFRPNNPVKRGDMAAFLFRLAKLWGVGGASDGWQPSGTASFSDVTEATSHYLEIMWLAESGISKGWDNHDGTFSFQPNSPVKRGDMAAFLARLYQLKGYPLVGSKGFADVSDATAHAAEIRWLAATGVSKGWDIGNGNAEFRPNADVKRGDMAAFLHRLDDLKQEVESTSYVIEFDANGGTGTMEDQIAGSGQEVTLQVNAFKRTNYSFAGWNTQADGKGTSYADKASVRDIAAAGGSVMLYAQWKHQTYTIKFDANGGTGTMKSQTANRGANVTLTANAFALADHDFAGWNTKADGSGKSYADKASVKDLASSGKTIILYAQWERGVYTIKFDANGGTGTMADLTANLGDSVALTANAFKRTDYTFTGWNTKADGSGTSYANKASVKNLTTSGKTATLYAQWKAQTYTIKFDANSGTGTMADQTANRGTSVTLKANAFTRSDYTFTGWNSKADGTGTAFADKGSVRDLAAAGKTIILYAQWRVHTYIVKYDGNEGLGTSSDQRKELGETFTLNKNPFSRKGFIFMAWNTKPDGSGTYYHDMQQVTNIGRGNEMVFLYAQWVTNEYTITYDANGGTGTMADQTATRGVITKLDKLAYRRENHCFVGWNTEPDGSGIAIEPSGYVTNPAPYVAPSAAPQEPANPDDPRENSCVKATLSYTDEVTLYAQWRHVTAWFRIDYEANGGTFTADYRNQLEADYQWIDLNTPQPLRAGLYEKYENGEKLVFAGWNTKADGTGVPYANKEVVYNVSGDYDTPDLFAQWERFDEAKFKDKLSTAYNRWRSSNGLNTAERNSHCDGLATASAEGCASRGHLVKGLGMTTINDKMRYRDIVATSTRQLTADELIQLWVADDSDRSGLAHPLASRFGVGVYVDKDNGVYWYALVYNLY